MPGRRVLIVEDMTSGYALPSMEDTVAVFGGGANVRWTQATWLSALSVGYWGVGTATFYVSPTGGPPRTQIDIGQADN